MGNNDFTRAGRQMAVRCANAWVGSLAVAAVFAGCAHVGPRSIPVDRADYSAAIAESWKQETLRRLK